MCQNYNFPKKAFLYHPSEYGVIIKLVINAQIIIAINIILLFLKYRKNIVVVKITKGRSKRLNLLYPIYFQSSRAKKVMNMKENPIMVIPKYTRLTRKR